MQLVVGTPHKGHLSNEDDFLRRSGVLFKEVPLYYTLLGPPTVSCCPVIVPCPAISGRPDAGAVLVYIHGGYWELLG